MNKQGSWLSDNWFWILPAVIIIIFTGIYGSSSFGQVLSGQGFQEALDQGASSFGYVWAEGQLFTNEIPILGENPPDPNNWKFLDYFFGKIPNYLILWAGGISASIIVLGIWFIFLFVFLDAINMFGNFNKATSVIIAFVLTIIIANLKLMMFVSVIALVITSIFGAFSVLASIVLVFGLFIAFHFGTSSIREKLIMRRAESYALRASAGGEVAASGIGVLSKIAQEAKKAEEATKRK